MNRLNAKEQVQVFGERLQGKQIRLLEITSQPESQAEGAISCYRCRLHRCDLSDQQFTAVSYSWGSLENPGTIYLGEVAFNVTRSVMAIVNLLSDRAARGGKANASSARDLLQGQMFWIDAICINQEDIVELEDQMKIMRQVYGAAHYTMVYLGQPQSGSDSAKLALDWLYDITEEPFPQFHQTPKELRLQRWRSERWALVAGMLGESWFRRRWTVQEVAVSPNALVIYGNGALRWARFADAIERCAYMWGDIAQKPGFQREEKEPSADPTPTLSIQKLRDRFANSPFPPSLFEILVRFRRCACKYPTQRIFALLGLCDETEQIRNDINLKLSPVQVFKRFVLSYIELYGNLDVLCACLEIARIKRREFRFVEDGLWIDPDPPQYAQMVYLEDLPTWVPNLSSFRVDWHLGPSLDLIRQDFSPIFDASRGCPNILPNLNIAASDNMLAVQGIEIDRVLAYHNETPVAHPDYQTKEASFWHRFWEWASFGHPLPEG